MEVHLEMTFYNILVDSLISMLTPNQIQTKFHLQDNSILLAEFVLLI